MGLLQIFIYAFLQGLTYFLPLPDQNFYLYFSKVLDWRDPDITIIIAVHTGALVAVVLYYLADLVKIVYYTIYSLVKHQIGPVSRIGIYLIVASIPVIIGNILLKNNSIMVTNESILTGCTTIVCGLALWISSYFNRILIWKNILKIEGERRDSLRHMSLSQSFFIGLIQILMFISGASRTAITISGGLFLGFRPEAAVRFSFLLLIPILLTSICCDGLSFTTESYMSVRWIDVACAFITTLVSSIIAIRFLVLYVSRYSFNLFILILILAGIFEIYSLL